MKKILLLVFLSPLSLLAMEETKYNIEHDIKDMLEICQTRCS